MTDRKLNISPEDLDLLKKMAVQSIDFLTNLGEMAVEAKIVPKHENIGFVFKKTIRAMREVAIHDLRPNLEPVEDEIQSEKIVLPVQKPQPPSEQPKTTEVEASPPEW